MAYNDPPDTDDIPKTPEEYRDGIYAEIRHIRHMAENVFWVLLCFTLIAALTAGWFLYQYELAQ